jgi:hypothetical protein
MPDRTRVRALAVALLLVLTFVAIGSLGPRGDALKDARAVPAVAALLELTLACLLVALRWRHTPATPVAVRLNQVLLAALITGLVVVPIGYFIYSADGNSGLFHGKIPVRISPRPIKGSPPPTQLLPHSNSVPWRELLIVALIVVVAATLLIAWRNRAKLSFADPRDLATDEESELARAVESGRAAFRQLDDARAAIIACYLAMETHLAKAGTQRGLAETPDELLNRAVAAGHAAPGPTGLLTGLFYEARFSSHPMPPAKRDQAERALADLAADLPIGQQR